MSVIVPVRAHLSAIASYVAQWEDGTMDPYTASQAIERQVRQMQRSCYCETSVCCPAHRVHVSPHRNCVLR